MAMRASVPFIVGEDVQIQFTLPDHKEAWLAESKICCLKSGRLGVLFASLSEECKSELQGWLSRKLEDVLPEFAGKFRKRHPAAPAPVPVTNHLSCPCSPTPPLRGSP